jgi:hypothetical protein
VVACLGLTPAVQGEVFAAAEPLVLRTLRFLRETDPTVDRRPDIARYISDGTFERLLL